MANGFFYEWTVTLDGFTYATDHPRRCPRRPRRSAFTPGQAGTYVVQRLGHRLPRIPGPGCHADDRGDRRAADRGRSRAFPTTATADLGSSLSLGASVTAATTALQNAGFFDTWTVAFGGATYGPYSGPALNLTTDGVGVYADHTHRARRRGGDEQHDEPHQRRGPRAGSVFQLVDPGRDAGAFDRVRSRHGNAGQVCRTGRGRSSSTGATTRPRRTTIGSAGDLPLAPHAYALAGLLPGHRHRHRRVRHAGDRDIHGVRSPGFRRRRRSSTSRRRSLRGRPSPSAAP